MEYSMSDDVSDIAAYYQSDPDAEHSRLGRHQLEHDLTWRYLNLHLPPQGSILEVGAATGRYTLELAKMGYRLTAVDLSAALMEECMRSVAGEGLQGEIAPLHEAIGFETLTLAGIEPAISADDESYNRLQGKQRQLWLDLLYEIGTDPSIIGASRHLLHIGRKPFRET